ncbi:MAG TPA: GGDEF domain-containing protein [Pirellulaceae bacterium]|nr:GGDEF domain-containing protein [Pirellulaceae bacterium]
MRNPARILLATRDEGRQRAWTEALRTARCQVVTTNGAPAEDIDVLVIDQPLTDANIAIDEERLSRGQMGMVAVGVGLPADVSLPEDHSSRELRLACLLLAEIVRLRRQREASRRQEKVLTHLALSDPLTGLPNRRAWEQQLNDRLGGAAEGSAWCMALLDVDLFHEINDRQGHLEGDSCLRRIADRLAGGVRRAGFLARLGGDEFAVLLEGIAADRAAAVVDLIRIQAGEDGDAAANRSPLKLSAGWAVLTGPANKAAAQDALERADAALREAKQSGRNRTRPANS